MHAAADRPEFAPPPEPALLRAFALAVLAHAQTNGTPERFSAAAIDPNRGTTSQVDITVDRWTSDAQRDRLLNVLLEDKPDKLLDALRDEPQVGSVRRPGGLSWDLRYARRVALPDGGERVVVITDRPLSFWEAEHQPRTVDYPFTVIELRLNRDGEGEGKMSVATKITADKENHIVTLENWDLQPVMLKSVKRERNTH
jgi:hypothetical protein